MKDKDKYTISDLPIKDGDFIYNIHTKIIDRCVAVFTDGDMVVQLNGSGRAVIRTEHYKKAIKN